MSGLASEVGRRGVAQWLLALGVMAVVAGCGQEFDRAAAIESFQRANPEVTGVQASCVVDLQIERYGIDGLADELESDSTSERFVDQQFRDMFACGVEGDIGQQLVEQLQATGVDEADAPCVADRLTRGLDADDIDVLLSGEITVAFQAKFVEAMEACGAAGTGG